jgi:hypothetical protein
MAENAVLFVTYGFLKRAMADEAAGENEKRLPLWKRLVAGAGTGVAVSFALTPFELVKCRMQVQAMQAPAFASVVSTSGTGAGAAQTASSSAAAGVVYRNPLHCVADTVRTGGIRALFRGNLSTLAREIPATTAWFNVCVTHAHLPTAALPRAASIIQHCQSRVIIAVEPIPPTRDATPSSYDFVSSLYPAPVKPDGEKGDPPLSWTMLAGSCAGVAYWSANFPADTVKSRVQTDPTLAGRGTLEVARSIAREEGIRALYRGLGITVIRAAPSHALLFATYEIFFDLLPVKGAPSA